MWIAILAGLFAPPPLLALGIGFVKLARCLRGGRLDRSGWLGLSLLALTLTGRWWVRLLRAAAPDEPQPLTPTRRGFTDGFGGVRLEWEQFGPDDAPALLLSHGWSLTHDTWYYQKKALSDEFRVIVWDMRGMGRSGEPADHNYSIDETVQDLAAVFDATDAGRHPAGCVLAGHSLGAMILPLFAVRFPDRMRAVRGLALLAGTDTPLLETMWGRRWLMPLRRPFWEPLGRFMAARPGSFQALARLLWQTGAVHAALIFGRHVVHSSRGQDDLVAARCGHFNMRAAGQGALSSMVFDTRSILPQISVPVLLLTGENDVNAPPEIQRAMATRLQNPELVLIPRCGHLNLLECHEAVSDHLRAFARRCFAETDRA